MDTQARSPVSRKQEIYREMLQIGLPGLRRVRSLRCWQRWLREALSEEAQLIHDLYVSILEPDFGRHDIWFLNHHARSYLKTANPRHSPGYFAYRQLIAELFRHVPDSLRDQLDWAGPTDDSESHRVVGQVKHADFQDRSASHALRSREARVLDPEFEDFIPKKGPAPPVSPPFVSRIPNRLKSREAVFRRLVFLAPIRWSAQWVFVEALRQGLAEGLAADRAIGLAAEVNPSHRFRGALVGMASSVRSGYPLDAALRRTEARVSPGLLAALRVGEEHGCLIEELAAFGGRRRVASPDRFRRAIGRSREATRFAAVLARLLRDHPLTVRIVRDTGQVASSGSRSFSRVIDEIAGKMENGSSFVSALRGHPSHFDALYCGFLEAAESREETRACLERLAGGPSLMSGV